MRSPAKGMRLNEHVTTHSHTPERNTCIALNCIATEKVLDAGCEGLGHETKARATANIAMGKRHVGRVEAEDELAHHYVVR